MASAPRISVVIPAYNEEGRLPETVERVREFLDERGDSYELILVDDGSSDGTLELMRSVADGRSQVKVITLGQNRGKGRAVVTGMQAATGDLVLFSDADLSTPIEEVAKLEAAVGEGADVAVASRALHDSQIEVSQPAMRVLMGKVFNLLVQGMLLVPGVWDTQCGFKLVRGRVVHELLQDFRTDGFAFDVEMLHRARRLHLKIAEVPVRWRHSAPTKVAWRHPLLMFMDLVRIRLGR